MVMTVAASSALLASSAFAADQKIGVVNMQNIMQQLPQTTAMMQSLQTEFKDQAAEVAQLEKDIKYYQEKQKRDASVMNDKEKEELNGKIAELFRTYQEKGKALQQQSQIRQNEETNKVLALVKQAIDNIAAKDEFDLVINQQAVVFASPDADISSKVVEQVSKLK